MKTVYVNGPKDVMVDQYISPFEISIRLGAGQTVTMALEAGLWDANAPQPTFVPTPAPDAVTTLIHLRTPVAVLRFVGAGQSTVMQAGIIA